MMLRNFCRLSFCLILLNIKETLCSRHSSLSFVIDDTFSMQNEIDQVTAAVDSIIDIMIESKTSEIADMVLVTFNDPDYKLLLKSSSRTEIKSILGSIVATGGGDCEEMALSGIKLGLEKSLFGSYMFVFTDDHPKDVKLKHDVIKLCQEKQIQVVFVVTPSSSNTCREGLKTNFKTYNKIAKACSGQVFRLSGKGEVNEILPYIKEIAKGPRTIELEKTIPANKTSTVKFTIDEETNYALVSASGQKVSLHLKSGPTPDTTYEEVVNIDNLKIAKVTKPGDYVFEVKGASSTSVVVFGRTDFTFQHGFSDNIPSSFNGSVTKPDEESETNLLISVDDPKQAVEIQSVIILDMDENVLQNIPLKHISGNYYAINKFVPPSTTFKLAVQGKNIRTGKSIVRTLKTNLTPNPKFRAPTITINDGPTTISVPYNSTLSLSCNVTAYPEPNITWSNENNDVLTQELLSDSLTKYASSISVPNIKTSQNYYCAAANKVGCTKTRVNVQVMEPFVEDKKPDVAPKVDTEISPNVRDDSSATLQCNVINGNLIATIVCELKNHGNASGAFLNLSNVSWDNAGDYKCVAKTDEHVIKLEAIPAANQKCN